MSATVLLVEDDVSYRVAMSKLLHAYFPLARVIEAEDGSQALSMTRLIDVDLVLLDYYLHAIGGGDVARYLRQRASAGHRPMPRLVLMSSQPDVDIFMRSLGAVAFLHKPCTAEQLVAVVGPLLAEIG